jgi:tetratricopeptide (TPR) repeat protein
MFELKPLSNAAVPAALEKAERYRLLNEPGEAESICLDILNIDPDNQDALVTLLLALTDQFDDHESSSRATHSVLGVVSRLKDEYQRTYYSGIISERRGKTHLRNGRFKQSAAAWLREAMDFYERAEAIRPEGNDDAVLRWNACARMLMTLPVHPEMQEEPVQSE